MVDRARVSAGVVLCTALLAAACAAGDSGGHPRLTQPGGEADGWFGMANGYQGAGDRMLLTSEVIVCLDRPGRVEIVEVGLKRVEGQLEVDAFAVRPQGSDYPDLEEGEDTLWRIGFTQGSAWIETVCPEPEELNRTEAPAGRWMELGISLSKPVAATARGSTLMIYYVPVGQSERHLLEIPFGVVLCEGEVADEETGVEHPGCDYLPDEYNGR